MFRNTYDSENTVFSPQGRLHQVEYALEAVKQGSAVVGLRSKKHAVLVALKRAPSELAAHQQKLLNIDSHMGIGFAGLTNDARVLSNYMRQLALSSRIVYSRPLPLSRIAASLADRAQLNTMEYGRRPYGVGFLIIGHDSQGPHLYEFSPLGTCFEYHAMSLGARSQSAKTYLERRIDEYKDEEDLEKLVLHGLYALRETLQQGKEVSDGDREGQCVLITAGKACMPVLNYEAPPRDADHYSPLSAPRSSTSQACLSQSLDQDRTSRQPSAPHAASRHRRSASSRATSSRQPTSTRWRSASECAQEGLEPCLRVCASGPRQAVSDHCPTFPIILPRCPAPQSRNKRERTLGRRGWRSGRLQHGDTSRCHG